MYPVVLWVHFVGLSMWLATSLSVDLRLMGVGARRQTAVELSSSLSSWKWIGFGIMLVAGFLLLSADATTYIANTSFRFKLAVLTPLALTWHVVVHKNTRAWTGNEQISTIGRWAGLIEFLFWISVVGASVGFLVTNA